MKFPGSERQTRGILSIPRRLASVKVGLMLVIVIFAFTLAAAFFPAREVVGFVRSVGGVLALDDLANVSELNFQERFESPPFLLLVAALSLSLCFSLYFRVKSELKRMRAVPSAPTLIEGTQQRSGVTAAAVDAVEQELRRRGYRTQAVCTAGSWKVQAGRGGSGVWGSVLFHVALLLVLAAVALSTTASFRASVKLIEGQAFDARVDSYGEQHAGRWYQPDSQPLTFRLARVEPDHEVNGVGTLASIVEPTQDGKRSRFTEGVPVYINRGLRHAGVTIHQGKEAGFAPLVKIEDAAGKSVLEGYTSLATMKGPEKESYLDYVEIGAENKKLRAEFELFPDAAYRDGGYLTKSTAPKNPVLHVVLRERGQVVFDQFIRLTATGVGGGYTVFFGNLRRWSQIDLSDAPGVPVLLAATVLGSLGLALRLLSVRRRVLVVLNKTDRGQAAGFDLSGSSEKFQHTFEEELASIRAALAQQLAALPRLADDCGQAGIQAA